MDKMNNTGKEGGYTGIIVIMLISLVIASLWDTLSIIKNSVGFALNPTAGALLRWNLNYGMTFLVFLLALFMTLIQKYTTDQKTLKEMKEQQKKMHEELKKLKPGSKEYNDLAGESMKFIGPMFKLGLRPIMYTAIPIILLFRWFSDYFNIVEFKVFGLGWFWFYLLGSIIFSSILRKILKVQ